MPLPSQSAVTVVQQDQLTCLQVVHPRAQATIALQGAQLLEYRATGERPLIWLSEQAAYRHGQSVRGGIPVCWPWFGDLMKNPSAVQHQFGASNPTPGKTALPAHGLVRNRTWVLERVNENEEGVDIILGFPWHLGEWPSWPNGVQLQLHIHVGQTLKVVLETVNTSAATIHFSQALHTYFAVSDSRAVTIEGCDGAHYIDTLQNWQDRRQSGAIFIDAEVDRIYRGVGAEMSVRDPAWQRRICLRTQNSRSAVVWNPWIDKSKRLSQFAEDAWQRMLCIETANVMEDMVNLAPSDHWAMGVELWSEPLPA